MDDEWINKMYMNTLEQYSVLKRKELLTYVTPWMYLKSIVMSEIRHSEKENFGIIPLI